MPRPTPVRPGFKTGARSLWSASRFLLGSPQLWPAALVPALLLIVVGSAAVYCALAWVPGWVEAQLPAWRTWYGRPVVVALSWLSTAGAIVLGLLFSLLLTPPLSAPALEHIVAARERQLGAPSRRSLGFVAEFWCGLRAMLLAACVATPIVLGLTLLEWLVPPLVFVTVPAKLVVAALSVAWNLLDYPLTLRGMGVRRRVALLRAQAGSVLGFGVVFAALFWFPCLGVLLLPVGVAAAAELVTLWLAEPAAQL